MCSQIAPHKDDCTATPNSALYAITRNIVRENFLQAGFDVLKSCPVQHRMRESQVVHRPPIGQAEFSEFDVFVIGFLPPSVHIQVDVLLKCCPTFETSTQVQ